MGIRRKKMANAKIFFQDYGGVFALAEFLLLQLKTSSLYILLYNDQVKYV